MSLPPHPAPVQGSRSAIRESEAYGGDAETGREANEGQQVYP